jgi:hypothetical protein
METLDVKKFLYDIVYLINMLTSLKTKIIRRESLDFSRD